jgi:hypothetical protein
MSIFSVNWFTEGVSERHFLIKWGLKSLSQLNLVNALSTLPKEVWCSYEL